MNKVIFQGETIESLQKLHETIKFILDGEIDVDGQKFIMHYTDYSLCTDSKNIIVCKPFNMLACYINLFLQKPFKNILEFGIHQGGSILFMLKLYNEIKKIIGVDIIGFNPVVDEVINKHNLSERVKLFYETSQDSPEIPAIIAKEFEEVPDIVIDDCSHQYEFTKKTFEIVFPLLKPGGRYIIEDWGWAHWADYQHVNSNWHNQPSLSNLIFEIIAVWASNHGWIKKIDLINSAFVVIERGYAEIPLPFNISNSYHFRGKKICDIIQGENK
jgi:cephalosporin hydroxylase